MSADAPALARLLALETAYRAWLDLVDDDAAGRRPADAEVLGTLALVNACADAVGPITADLCWRRVSRGRGTAPLPRPTVPGAPS
jgi:hypothetical protein